MPAIPTTVTVTVPATTANIGAGFDCIGAALTLYNKFKFSLLPEQAAVEIILSGVEADRVNTGFDNLAYQSFLKLYQHLGKTPPPVKIEIELGVPLARGLGSSATAIVGGLVGANILAGSPLSQDEVMQCAIALEGHPDNVVPALLGGCRLAATGLNQPSKPEENLTNWEICDIPWHSEVVPVVAIPDFELSTAEARRVLPSEYSRADAIFNTAHLGLLLRALETGRKNWLQASLQDRIHQPYRQALIPGYDAVYSAAIATGAYGMVISGAGPTLLALVDKSLSAAVVTAMTDAWQQHGIKADVKALQIDTKGAAISS